LLYYASAVIEPALLPFHVSQTSGLPRPFKAPVVAAAAEPVKPAVTEPRQPEIIAAKIALPAPAKARKAVHKRKPAQVEQERYAGYPPREVGSVW
jgi:hypothetical protein